jgi:hypothetical protein
VNERDYEMNKSKKQDQILLLPNLGFTKNCSLLVLSLSAGSTSFSKQAQQTTNKLHFQLAVQSHKH